MNKKFRPWGIGYIAWLVIFAIIPMLIMVALTIVDCEGVDFKNSSLSLISFDIFASSSEGVSATVIAFANSILYAIITCVCCIVLGYIIAYKIFRSHFKNKFLVITLLILPMWSNILLRIYALKSAMEEANIVISLLQSWGFENVHGILLAGRPIGVIIGLIVTYLPFMVLTIYTALEKVEYSLEEAALDLGLTEMKKFWKVVFPLSVKGIVTGSIMVFLPCISGFAIPEILGYGDIVLIGNIIDQLFRDMNYNSGALLAIVILFFILGSILLVNKFDKDGETLI